LATFAGGEAQAAAIADDIAYDTHDIDDGLRAGLLSLESLREISLVKSILEQINREYPDLAIERTKHELVRRLITVMIEDVITESLRRLDALNPISADAIRNGDRPVIGFGGAMADADREIKSLLSQRVYRHARVLDVMTRAEDLVSKLFRRYFDDPSAMPEEWQPDANADDAKRGRRVADFLAGMTDRYAVNEYERLFDAPAELG
jgi:dGTPase